MSPQSATSVAIVSRWAKNPQRHQRARSAWRGQSPLRTEKAHESETCPTIRPRVDVLEERVVLRDAALGQGLDRHALDHLG